MSKIILEAGNPFDFDEGELATLADDIHRAAGKTTTIVAREERGYGVTLHEVIHVWIPWKGLEGAAASQVFSLAVSWARARWKRDHDEHPQELTRPRSVIIWGADNKPLRSVVVDSTGDEPEISEQGLGDIPERRRPTGD